ncbi:pyridoxine 5'-phosphate synthase [Sulfurospirillum sp. T05]|uniref:Pyridoxine 5'-phosphate synthase n=1 Tax=Sulfurospirillum tamanense TaxID=2813362 RepID=A0ABS2WSG0_9BACT|nr:pyridoxine 5'-phosphate synthase [Sulfurospirillum tamanensis]MBN2964606.1 pyridoxine 5'-phosphate synthase [Sulfurospirillum tamanensis]
MLLGVNIDHIAVLREARRINDPDPLDALGIVKRAGADQVTIHLREDRRHIHDEDAKRIVALSPLPVNLECAMAPEMLKIATTLLPHRVTLVPEKREEVTTEGGLDVEGYFDGLKEAVKLLQTHGIEVSLFIDPTPEAVRLSQALHVEWVELHTGAYANLYAMLYGNLANSHHSIKALELPRSELKNNLLTSLKALEEAAKLGTSLGLRVAAGHGLNYQNVETIARMRAIEELNIGQSVIARSVFTGLEEAIVRMRELVR